jgi:hypothetical protein
MELNKIKRKKSHGPFPEKKTPFHIPKYPHKKKSYFQKDTLPPDGAPEMFELRGIQLV